jgi:hypothetical protein
MCVKVKAIRKTKYTSLCVSLSIIVKYSASNHSEIQAISYQKFYLWGHWDRWKEQKMISEC